MPEIFRTQKSKGEICIVRDPCQWKSQHFPVVADSWPEFSAGPGRKFGGNSNSLNQLVQSVFAWNENLFGWTSWRSDVFFMRSHFFEHIAVFRPRVGITDKGASLPRNPLAGPGWLLHCNENPIDVFPEKELHGLGPNFRIHVSVSDIQYIFLGSLHIQYFLQQNRQTDGGKIQYKSLTDTWMWILVLRIFVSNFR